MIQLTSMFLWGSSRNENSIPITFPEINSSPLKNWRLEDEVSFLVSAYFQWLCAVSFREGRVVEIFVVVFCYSHHVLASETLGAMFSFRSFVVSRMLFVISYCIWFLEFVLARCTISSCFVFVSLFCDLCLCFLFEKKTRERTILGVKKCFSIAIELYNGPGFNELGLSAIIHRSSRIEICSILGTKLPVANISGNDRPLLGCPRKLVNGSTPIHL